MSQLLEEILSKENVTLAIKEVVRKKGGPGVDGMTVLELNSYFDEHYDEIANKIRNRKYKPLPVKRVEIPKSDGTKRPLGIPSVKDRVIQQAIYQVMSPMCEEIFSDHSYGFRPNRSIEKAVIKSLEYFNDGYDWVVDLDLSKFFDNVDQNILMMLVHRIITDGDTESIIRKFLQSGVNIGGNIMATEKGTPQGGNLSPLLANIYLDRFDKELEARGLHFTRYADDCVICVKSEMAANRVMASVTKWLKEKLRVEVNVTKTKVARPRDIKYLGYGFYFDDTKGYRPKPHIRTVARFEQKLKEATKRNKSISIDEMIKNVNAIIRGWVNAFRICDMRGILSVVDSHLRLRIRMRLWVQWKTPHNRRKQLTLLGVNKDKAYRMSYSRKGPMRCANNPIVNYALRNSKLKEMGLLFAVDHYDLVHNF